MTTFRKILAIPFDVLMWIFLAPGLLFMMISSRIKGYDFEL